MQIALHRARQIFTFLSFERERAESDSGNFLLSRRRVCVPGSKFNKERTHARTHTTHLNAEG
jgi:hypothetical protein